MESRCYPVRLSSCKSLLSLVCITLKLCRSTGGSELCFSNAIYHGNFVLSVTKLQVLILRYKRLILVALHKATETSEEFLKLIMLLALGQYLLRFPLTLIDQTAKLDARCKNEEYRSLLAQFRSFQIVSLDEFINELYSAVNPLFHSKEPRNLSKLKLQEILIFAGKHQLFRYSFCYVVIKLTLQNKYDKLYFAQISTLVNALTLESDKLSHTIKSKGENIPENFMVLEVDFLKMQNDVNLLMGPRVVNIVQIPVNNFTSVRLYVCCIFKIRRNYQKVIRRSDLSSMLTSQKYIRIFRNDENLSKSQNQSRKVSIRRS